MCRLVCWSGYRYCKHVNFRQILEKTRNVHECIFINLEVSRDLKVRSHILSKIQVYNARIIGKAFPMKGVVDYIDLYAPVDLGFQPTRVVLRHHVVISNNICIL